MWASFLWQLQVEVGELEQVAFVKASHASPLGHATTGVGVGDDDDQLVSAGVEATDAVGTRQSNRLCVVERKSRRNAVDGDGLLFDSPFKASTHRLKVD